MITLTIAQNVIMAALGRGRELGLPPMTVAVLDAGGHLVAFAREDRSSLLREKIARGKAMGALNMGVGSRSLAERAEGHPHFFAAITAQTPMISTWKRPIERPSSKESKLRVEDCPVSVLLMSSP